MRRGDLRWLCGTDISSKSSSESLIRPVVVFRRGVVVGVEVFITVADILKRLIWKQENVI